MDKTKHHFIPKFVLKNFSKKSQIYLYRHDLKRVICCSTRDAFTQSNLNTITNESGNPDKNIIEDIYEKYFETNASISIRKVISDLSNTPPNAKEITADDYLRLLRFAILSQLRTPFALEEAHHAMRVSAYGAIYLKYYLDFGTVHFPYDLDIPKELLFHFLDNFDEATKLLQDLKMNLLYHNLDDAYFFIPDQYVIITSPNNTKFGDQNLKIYMPISSNAILCFERVERKFFMGRCELDYRGVEDINKFILSNTYESFGCENKEYMEAFVHQYSNQIVPLKRFDPYEGFDRVKKQVKAEIIAKLAINFNNDDFSECLYTQLDMNHEFRILSEKEFEKIEKLNNNIFGIRKRVYEI